MNRSLSYVSAIAFLVVFTSTSTLAQQPTTPRSASLPESGTVNQSSHVRRGPGPRYGGLWWIENGERVKILDHSGGWAKIVFSGGRGGWIDGQDLDEDRPVTTSASSASAPKLSSATAGLASNPTNPAADPSAGRIGAPNPLANGPSAPSAVSGAGISITHAEPRPQPIKKPASKYPPKPDALASAKTDPLSGTQATPAATLGDSFKMLLCLLPILAVVILAIRGLKAFQERAGRMPRPSKPKASLLGSLNLINARKTGGSSLRVIESIPIGSAALHLVEVRGQLLLLGAAGSNLTKLAELDGDESAADTEFRTQLSIAAQDLGDDSLAGMEEVRGRGMRLTIGEIEDQIRRANEAVVSIPRARAQKVND